MKKLFAAFLGLLIINGAFAAVTTATSHSVNKVVNDTKDGVAGRATPDNILIGVTPQTGRLTTAEGTLLTENQVNNTAVGDLAQKTNNAPTEKINANTDNLTVLKRDKLVIPGNPAGDGHCENGDECGYVTTTNSATANSTSDKVWVRITRCTANGVCEE